MATVQKLDTPGKITYSIVSGAPPATFVIYKDTKDYHVEITTAWPVAGHASWQDYIALFEEAHALV